MDGSRIDMKRFGRELELKRNGKGWARKRFADRIGKSDTYVRKLEEGRIGSIGLANLVLISDALQVPLAEFLRDMGLDPMGPGLSDFSKLTDGLSLPELRALLRNAHALREVRESYEALQRLDMESPIAEGSDGDSEVELVAHGSGEEASWEVDSELTAAGSGRDLARLKREEDEEKRETGE